MKLLFVFFFLSVSAATFSQASGDTLSLDKEGSGPYILRAELDSIVQARIAEDRLLNSPQVVEAKPDNQTYPIAGFVLVVILLLLILRNTYISRRKLSGFAGHNIKPGSKQAPQVSEIEKMKDEILKLSRENENLNKVIAEYNGIKQDYESLKHGIMTTYKVKHYPGYEKEMEDYLAFQGVFDTESSVANYAYQKFLKPVLAIADRNKNNPARVSDEERQRVLDLLVSLSLLYIEYLYLRVGDLSIGGKMVERIKGLAKGNGFDPALLKKMNTVSGNRALVLRMILDRSDLHKLTYPVFDETNLNN